MFTIFPGYSFPNVISLPNFCHRMKFAMCFQIRRVALSVHLNIAEGASRKSETERKRFYEISRGSLIEIDTILDLQKKRRFGPNRGAHSKHLSIA